ncbi:MAG: amino-acid N-acetyltransferase [Spirochaetales bacterium]|nr:amino-acid N-acetyltransferase [Spirochaetales bacterium]
MNSSDIIDQVDLIRQVFTYAHRFRGKTFVIHVDYAAVEGDGINALVQDVALLHRAGIRIILVPGARQRIDEVLARYNVSWRRERGIRIASAESIPFIKMAAFDVTNRFMTLLAANHANAVVGNWVRARGIGVVDGVDYDQAGVVERVRLDLLRSTLLQEIIPIFPCIGWSATGKPYNISSRELAFRIAVSIEADKLFFVTDNMEIGVDDIDVPSDIDHPDSGRINRLTVEEAGAVLAHNGIVASSDEATAASADEATVDDRIEPSGYHEGRREHLEYLRLAYLAARTTVNRVHIVDGGREGVVLVEVFSDRGVGTMVHGNVYQSIRPMRLEDVGKVHNLLQPLAASGVLVARSPDDIATRYADFVVHETDGRIHGCGALHEYANGEAEIAALAVDSHYEELGIGRRIVLYLMERARAMRLPAVFVLTTRTIDWFESIGFSRVEVDRLPEEKRRRYDADRRSVVLRYSFENE